ncbi:PREDICTED: uncharacterized protein C16orf95 homolog [Condylura cristata]|uniref:uncharacterized protein C16orf95 homolog n=1 Tax=Condylura cristata TaxID=143302 RepID=UPI0006438C64|nr:PREDICTED: uncharacterized protein C16orf95 homolog [Condylura cristata]
MTGKCTAQRVGTDSGAPPPSPGSPAPGRTVAAEGVQSSRAPEEGAGQPGGRPGAVSKAGSPTSSWAPAGESALRTLGDDVGPPERPIQKTVRFHAPQTSTVCPCPCHRFGGRLPLPREQVAMPYWVPPVLRAPRKAVIRQQSAKDAQGPGVLRGRLRGSRGEAEAIVLRLRKEFREQVENATTPRLLS